MKDKKNKDIKIPDKLYFKIGEVSAITGLPRYVLRFWESEFKKNIKLKRTAAGQRLYARKDIERILMIKTLLHEKKYTIKGAKNYLNTVGKVSNSKFSGTLHGDKSALSEIRKELKIIRDMLS